ncbi:MAG: GNAT family N-acetyltransferase [Aristaeellaceae bacterium]
MADMLVHLLDLPDAAPYDAACRKAGIRIIRAMAPDQKTITAWVEKHFGPCWASECAVCFTHQPITCFIAVREKEILGFACYEATCKAFFGPIGVREDLRGSGIGAALLIHCLHGLRDLGYAYGIIGGVGPVPFYEKTVHATLIPDSTPGIYRDLLG